MTELKLHKNNVYDTENIKTFLLLTVVDFQHGVRGNSITNSIFCYAFVLGLVTLHANRFNAKKSASDGIFVN